MGLDLRSLVFDPVLAQLKKRADSLRNIKRFDRCGLEAWLKVEVVAALGERVRAIHGKGPDLLLDDGTDAGTRLELKAATNFDRSYFLGPLRKYCVPCLFLGDGSRFESGSEAALFLKNDRDDFEVIRCEVFPDNEGQWVVGLMSPRQSQDQSRPHPARRGVQRAAAGARTSFKAALERPTIEIADLLQILAFQLGQNVQAGLRCPGKDFHGVPRKATEIAVRPYQHGILQTTDPLSGDPRQ